MSLFKEQATKQVSYIDLYGFAGMKGLIKKPTLQKVKDYRKDVLFGFPPLDKHIVDKCLYLMGMDTRKEVEEMQCHHRPNCLAHNCSTENKPVVYGLCYFGLERTDEEWMQLKRTHGI